MFGLFGLTDNQWGFIYIIVFALAMIWMYAMSEWKRRRNRW